VLLGAHLERGVEGAARSNDAQLFVEYDHRLPDCIDDALSQSTGVCDIGKLLSEICFLHRVRSKFSQVVKRTPSAGRASMSSDSNLEQFEGYGLSRRRVCIELTTNCFDG
jgi:hypothetical protein